VVTALAEALLDELQHAPIDLLVAAVADDEERGPLDTEPRPSSAPGLDGSFSRAHTTSSMRSHRPRAFRNSVTSAHFRQSLPSAIFFLTMVMCTGDRISRLALLFLARRHGLRIELQSGAPSRWTIQR
jgi:hypothetical protein